ncbi:MAG: rRNA cytosine-C5-methyltransferase [Bacteroidaceae bacterium]|nr:rRNA cytosine-C5-methyltransferase [Bacteroidaceae bacterium]MBR5706126.1 rRNA cytosine-C5-methyltransferase [Bacteroidaceae bacterium]
MQLPEEFINMLPLGERDALLAALATEPEVSIRFNTKAADTENLVLESLDCRADARVPWMNDAVYLDHRPQFTMDPLLHQGCYYVQEASSMFLAHALKKCVSGPVRALDLCAAPGGKSTLLAGLLPEGSLLISNEIQRSRAQILAENMVKWGRPGVMVTCNTPKQIGESSLMFDLIAVDAPCSGEGMFRKDEGAVRDWSIGNVEMCAARQREIIADIWPALKPGGHMIYSTCTFNRQEDEDNVRWVMERFGAEAIDLAPDQEWNILGSLTDDNLPVYHFMQHRTRGEGFFLCLLRKPEGSVVSLKGRPFKADSSKIPAECRKWVEDGYEFYVKNESIYALPSALKDDMWQAGQELYALVPGIEVAVIKGRDWVPAHSLAMSTALNRSIFDIVEVTRQQALAYLHCDAIRLDDAPRGIVLLTYKNIPLGFAKNIGNRANNMYPQEWRIRNSIS